MPLDPTVDIGRKAWLPCPECDHGCDCPVCLSGRTCSRHWQYVLSNSGSLVHLQCPSCAHLWEHDHLTEQRCA
jgi:hypothetical protein